MEGRKLEIHLKDNLCQLENRISEIGTIKMERYCF